MAKVFDPDLVDEAIQDIAKIRYEPKRENPRQFKKPGGKRKPTVSINWEANFYSEMVNIEEYDSRFYCSPPLLEGYTLEEIKQNDFKSDLLLVRNNSQAVEMHVQWSAKAAKSNIGYAKTHAALLNMEESTAKICTRPTKSDFKTIARNQ